MPITLVSIHIRIFILYQNCINDIGIVHKLIFKSIQLKLYIKQHK